MNDSIITIENLSKNYGHNPALKNVSLDLSAGQIVGLCGPNGSGKTTMIKILNGLLKQYHGTVLIDGHQPDVHTRSLISYLPDVFYLADWMSAKEVISLFNDLYQDFDKEKLLELLNRMNINTQMRVKEMSKGTREKFQLALVMSRRAKIYILDEPIGGVDPAARDLILDTILSNYEKDALVLLSTHLIQDVERIFDSVIFLKEGEVALFDDVDNLRQKEQRSIDELFREIFRC